MADGHPLLPWIVDCPAWDEEASDPRAVTLLMGLLVFLDPRVIVESGTYRGHTALHLGAIAEKNGMRGHVWTADPLPRGVSELMAANGLSDRVTVYEGSFDKMLPLVPKPIDLAYLDASAQGDDAMRLRHLGMVMDHLAPTGVIAVDDTAARTGDWDSVELIRQTAHLHLDARRGLSLFQRRQRG